MSGAVLDRARSMTYEVGTNVKGRGIGAAWTFALPKRDLGVALVVGRVSTAEQDALSGLARQVIRIEGVADGPQSGGRFAEAVGVDLVRFGRGAERLMSARPELAARVARALGSDGVAFGESARVLPGNLAELAGHHPLTIRRLLAAPARGAVRIVAPAEDRRARDRLTELGHMPLRTRGRLRMVEAVRRRLGARQERAAWLAGRDPSIGSGPPRYVADIARQAGQSIARTGWAIVAPGDYASQKVLMLLFEAERLRPVSLVKLGSQPEHLERLENEADALRVLATLPIAEGRAPTLRFAGQHAGRGVVGEAWVDGRPFRTVARAAPDCPSLDDATEWLLELATTTAADRDAGEVGAALRDLLDRFRAVYQLPDTELAVLEASVQAVEDHGGRLPVVLQHGDPGTWNLLVSPEGRTVFLDWESAEPRGMPFWDLLYFQRSYGSLVSRRDGIRRRLDAAARHLVSVTPLQARFVEDIRRMTSAIGWPTELVGPMIYACWMHRSLKEATRLTPASLHRGHYLSLLRLLIDRRRTPALRGLVADVDR